MNDLGPSVAAHHSFRSYIEPLEQRTLLSVVPSPAAALGHATAALSQARYGMGAAAIDGRAVFAGGDNLRHHESHAVDVYDPATGLWTVGAPAPRPLASQGVAIGVGSGPLALFATPGGAVEAYDVTADRWSIVSNADGTRSHEVFGGLVVGATAIFPTTETASGAVTYDPATNRLRRLALPPPRPTGFLSPAVAVGTKALFLISGIGKPPRARLYIDDTLTDQGAVTRFADDTQGPTVAVGPLALFFKGIGSGSFVTYDTVTDQTATVVAPDGVIIEGPSAAVIGTKVLIPATSESGPFVHSGYIAVYDTATDQWSFAPLSAYRENLTALAIGDQAIFAGGDVFPLMARGAVDVYTDQSPSAVLSGGVAGRGRHEAEVVVTNTGDADYGGPYVVQVYATPPHRLKGAVLLGSVTLDRHLAPGSSVRVAVPLSVPAGVAAGTYHYVAAVAQASDTSHPTPVAGGTATFRLGGGGTSASPAVRPAAAVFSRVPLAGAVSDDDSSVSLFGETRRRQGGLQMRRCVPVLRAAAGGGRAAR